mmetsp:Transcript_13821/g.20363  ORF Transcript_13821/g.20363 Transcript_13821/m.20363 type:complete len:209 (-) Transcript_13821:181-807(-)
MAHNLSAIIAFLVAASAVAFNVAPARMTMSQTGITRQNFGAAVLAGAAGAAVIAPGVASATKGDGAKYSVFGGAASEPYSLDEKMYSPYSAWGSGEGRIYNVGNKEEFARKISVVKESEKRLSKIPAYLERKQWEEVRAETTRQMYELRGAMNYLVDQTGSADAAAAKSSFYSNLVELSVSSRRKNLDEAKAYYDAAKSDLVKFTKAF